MLRCIKNDSGTIDQSMTLGPAEWPHFDLIVVHSGQIKLQLTSKRKTIDSGQAILLYPGTPFRGSSVTPEAKISVHHFQPDHDKSLPPSIARFAGKESGYRIFRQYEASDLEHDIRRVVELAHKPAVALNEAMRSTLMVLIIAQLQAGCDDHPPRASLSPEIQNLIAWLNENLAEKITLDDMATRVGLSTSRFRSIFKNQLGTSPGAYLLDLRLNEAARLLRETLTPIKKIVSLTGYTDIAYFYHAFRSHFKTTPKAYRDRHLPLG
ncbi:MAG: AraC family transcriptional regulator [Verrucomicrobiota bacterium]